MARVTIEADTYVAAIDGNLDGDLNDLDLDDNPDVYEDILQIDTSAEDILQPLLQITLLHQTIIH